jgi:hypothetical protein
MCHAWRIARLSKVMPKAFECEIYANLVPGQCLEQGLPKMLRGYGLMSEGGVLTILESNDVAGRGMVRDEVK